MIAGIIPARYASTRFPGKSLIDIQGKSMIQRVYEQAAKSSLKKIVVATDDQRIYDHVIQFGGEAVMTSADHPSGTDRCWEAVQQLKETYQYKQGQYITLRTTINGQEVRRSYSICSSPLDNELRVAVKTIPRHTRTWSLA